MRAKEKGSEERRQAKAKKEQQMQALHCKFRPVSVCSFKGTAQSSLLSARKKGRESEKAEVRTGFRHTGRSGGWS